ERPRLEWPRLARDEMPHVRPRVEGLREPRQDHRRTGPAERLHRRAEPDLERLRGDGLDVRDHLPPAGIARDDRPAHVRDGAHPDAEDDEVEVLPDPERPRGGAPRIPVALEPPPLGPDALALLELRVVGRRRPAR